MTSGFQLSNLRSPQLPFITPELQVTSSLVDQTRIYPLYLAGNNLNRRLEKGSEIFELKNGS